MDDFVLEGAPAEKRGGTCVLVDMPREGLIGGVERLRSALSRTYTVRAGRGRVIVYGKASLRDACRRAVREHNELMRAKRSVVDRCVAGGQCLTLHAKCRQVQRGVSDAEVGAAALPRTADGTVITVYRRGGVKQEREEALEGLEGFVRGALSAEGPHAESHRAAFAARAESREAAARARELSRRSEDVAREAWRAWRDGPDPDRTGDEAIDGVMDRERRLRECAKKKRGGSS